MKKKPIREPCDWWFHKTVNFQIMVFCANEKSENRGKTECPRQTCSDYAIDRSKDK